MTFDDGARIDAAPAHRIDAASFEDGPAFAASREKHGYALSEVATTVTLPMALYSRKLTSLTQIQRRADPSFPPDRDGMARALIPAAKLHAADVQRPRRSSRDAARCDRQPPESEAAALPRERLVNGAERCGRCRDRQCERAAGGTLSGARQHRHGRRALAYAGVPTVRDAGSRPAVGRATEVAAYPLGRRRAFHSHALSGLRCAGLQ